MYIRSLFFLGCFMPPVVSVCAADQPAIIPRERYLLIERKSGPDDESPLGSFVFEETGIKKDSELGKFLQIKKITKWQVFEDERVRFAYPDHPGIVVKAADKRAPLGTHVYGGPVGSVGRKSSRYYTIGNDKVTWAVLMLQDEAWFDEGICMCGAVALRVYVPDQGCLRAYDLLEDGRLKKAQVLGEGVRLQVFEWTHLPMSQDSYLRLTESVALKNAGTKTADQWSAAFDQRASARDRMGWLAPGMTEAEVTALLGQPDERKRGTLIFKETDEDKEWLTTTRIALPGGRFKSLAPRWRVSKEIPPDPGTLRWALKLVRDEKHKATEAELTQLKSSCLANLKSCPGHQWNEWCQVADALIDDAGWKETALGPLIASRFLDKDVVVNQASILLGDLNPPGTQEIVAKRLRFVLDETAKPEALKDKYLHFSPLGDFHNLLCQVMPKENRLKYVREGIVHPHRAVRWKAYWWLDKLPQKEALAAALKGLTDDEEYVRRNSAEAFEKTLGSKEQLPLLKRRLEQEKDNSTRESLSNAVKRLESAR